MSKPFKTLEEQISILLNRKLIIENIDEAKFLLTRYSYYSVINGYKNIFLKEKNSKNEEDHFMESTTLKDIINLHDFDKMIRNEIVSVLENIENTIAANISYIIAERFGDKQLDYLREKHFKLGKRTRNGKFQREILIEELKKICNSDEHPMKHYRENHSNVPPWILVQGATFGNLVYIYKMFKKDEKDYLISRCLGIPFTDIDEQTKEFFMKMLEVFRKFRNWAAHGGRIYSHKVKEELPYYEPAHGKFNVVKQMYDTGRGKNDILALIIAVAFFLKIDPPTLLNFLAGINYYLERYKKENSQYYFKVLQNMGLPTDYEVLFFSDIRKVNYSDYLQNITASEGLEVV